MKITIPREHGTWAMLYAPIIIAFASAPYINIDVLALLIAITSLFFLREPLEKLIRLRQEAWLSDSSIILLCVIAASSGVFLLVRGFWFLFLFLMLFISLLAIHLLLQSVKKSRKILSELLAIAGLTCSGLATRAVLIGQVDKEGYLLWLLCFLFFSSSVFYLKMRISNQMHNKDSMRFTILCLAFHSALLLVLLTLGIYKIIPMYTAAAYLPIIVRAFVGMANSGKINLKRIGIAEVVYTIIFAGVLILTEVQLL
jgi:YwiC-like protein